MDSDQCIEGMALDEYMEKCITYNNKLQISGPDESLLYTPSETSSSNSHTTNDQESAVDCSKMKSLSLSNCPNTKASIVSTSLLNNCHATSILLQNKIPLLRDIDKRDSNSKLIGNGSNISFSQPDFEGKSLLRRIEAFLAKELAATKEVMNFQDTHSDKISSGHSLLLVSNTKLKIYKQAFSVSSFEVFIS